jgi:hypothetical protein
LAKKKPETKSLQTNVNVTVNKGLASKSNLRMIESLNKNIADSPDKNAKK